MNNIQLQIFLIGFAAFSYYAFDSRLVSDMRRINRQRALSPEKLAIETAKVRAAQLSLLGCMSIYIYLPEDMRWYFLPFAFVMGAKGTYKWEKDRALAALKKKEIAIDV